MTTPTRARVVQVLIAAVVFYGVLVVGLVVVGTSSPFWQLVVVGVVAGLLSLAVRLAAVRLSR